MTYTEGLVELGHGHTDLTEGWSCSEQRLD